VFGLLNLSGIQVSAEGGLAGGLEEKLAALDILGEGSRWDWGQKMFERVPRFTENSILREKISRRPFTRFRIFRRARAREQLITEGFDHMGYHFSSEPTSVLFITY
jgi:hypothetical protein